MNKTEIKHMNAAETAAIAATAAAAGLAEAARIHGRNWATCRNACLRLGVSWKKQTMKGTTKAKAKAVEMRRKGAKLREIAAKFGCTVPLASNWCRDSREAAR
jgi:hypothetical protein